MSSTKHIRVPETVHEKLKQEAEKQDRTIPDVAEQYFAQSLSQPDSDDLRELVKETSREAVEQYLEHLIHGDCDEHQEQRQALGLAGSQDLSSPETFPPESWDG